MVYNNAGRDNLEYMKSFKAACKTKADITEADYEKVEDDSNDGFPLYGISLV